MRSLSSGLVLLLLSASQALSLGCTLAGGGIEEASQDAAHEDFGLGDTDFATDAKGEASPDGADSIAEDSLTDSLADSLAADTAADGFVDSTTDSKSEVAPDGATDGGCTPACTSCGAADGCGGTCKTGTCAGSATCVAGICITPTVSYLSPGTYPASWSSAFAKPISWTMASEAPSTIRYTLDGTTPVSTSASGASPLTIFVSTSATTLKWFADDGASESTVHSFVVAFDSTLQSGYGYVVDTVKLDSTTPVVVTTPGKLLTGSMKWEAWVRTVGTGACPLCRMQIVYGVGTSALGCLYDASPGGWPGASGTSATTITAPATAGTYKVRVAWALQNNCTDAITIANPLDVKPTTEVGTIVVK